MTRLSLPHFLFINGPSGSGKSTLAELICASHPEAFRESFAEPIREMIYAVFFPSDVVNRPIDLRSGPIKSSSLIKLAKLESDEKCFSSEVTVRAAMINFSENYMKRHFGNGIFGQLLFSRCVEQTAFYQNFIIDDSGFKEEAEYVISKVGADSCHLIRLHRCGCDFASDSRGYISLPGVQTLDLHNDGTPSEMLDLLALELNEAKLSSL